ncbi:DNA-binding protein, partial [Bacillus pseudomycoides]
MINSFIKLVRNISHLFTSSETLQQNRSFLFKREEVEKLKGELEVEGITLYQAS